MPTPDSADTPSDREAGEPDQHAPTRRISARPAEQIVEHHPASVPGGRVSLPRLDCDGALLRDEPADTTFRFVGTAFVRAQPTEPEAIANHSAFEEYFTFASLFAEPDAPDSPRVPGPFEILGLERGASWTDVVAAHRRLAKANHPDHLFGSPDDVRSAAEERLRIINGAYAEIRSARRDRGLGHRHL